MSKRETLIHKNLVARGVRWLSNSREYPVVVSGIGTGWEIPDVFGWRGAGFTAVIEAKASVADFRKDASKPFRKNPEAGLGGIRYFLVPLSLRDKVRHLVPDKWGLLAAGENSVFEVVKPGYFEHNKDREEELLIKIIRRIARPEVPLRGMNIKWYVPFGERDNPNNELYVEPEEQNNASDN